MKKSWFISFILLALAASGAHAGLVNGSGNVVSPPGVYMGTGIQNGGWTGDSTANVEVALRAKDRETFAVYTPDSSDTYFARAGTCVGTCGSGSRAFWNYEFSVNTHANGAGGLNLNQVFVQLMVDTDPTVMTAFTSLDVFSNWGDNDYWSGTERSGATGGPLSGEYGVQQSANPVFANAGFGGLIPGNGLYDFRLDVFARNANGGLGNRLATTSMQVQVGDSIPVPEPTSITLAGAALLGLFATSRRRKTP